VNALLKALAAMACCCSVSGMAAAQQAAPPAGPTAQSEAGEPRADTSVVAPSPAPAAPAPAAPTLAAPVAPAAAAHAPAGSTTVGRSPPHTAPAAGTAAKQGSKTDRLDLGTATVTGDREQPKVMYIVPWKKSDIGDLAGKPMNSLVDEILAPVDRDVFKREVVYYHAVQADASQNGAPLKPAQQGEK
jgi:hypothetical protein